MAEFYKAMQIWYGDKDDNFVLSAEASDKNPFLALHYAVGDIPDGFFMIAKEKR